MGGWVGGVYMRQQPNLNASLWFLAIHITNKKCDLLKMCILIVYLHTIYESMHIYEHSYYTSSKPYWTIKETRIFYNSFYHDGVYAKQLSTQQDTTRRVVSNKSKIFCHAWPGPVCSRPVFSVVKSTMHHLTTYRLLLVPDDVPGNLTALWSLSIRWLWSVWRSCSMQTPN